MAVYVLGTVKPKNGKSPVAEAQDILMTDGSRLDETVASIRKEASDAATEIQKDIDELGNSLNKRIDDLPPDVYPETEGATTLLPEKYYVFGEVGSLAVTLKAMSDGLAHEYAFEFVAAENFNGFSVSPAPRWNVEPQIVPGKTYQVSILRGIGVMIGV